jgi:hypothetical protein
MIDTMLADAKADCLSKISIAMLDAIDRARYS